MFERFSDASRRVVVFAQDEARGLGHGYVGTEHILLGVLDETENPAAQVLHGFGVTHERVHQAVQEHAGRGDEPAGDDLLFSPRAKAAIQAAFRSAQPRATLVEPVHLLLGALRQEGARAYEVVRLLGVHLPMLQAALRLRAGELTTSAWVPEDVLVSLQAALMSSWPRASTWVGGHDLLDRLTDAALMGLAAGQREARRLGRDSLSPEFLVLGLLLTEGEARDALVAADASPRGAREALELICPPVDARDVEPPLPDESVRQALSDRKAGASGEPIRSSDLLQAVLARSVGAWLLLRAAGADLAALKKLTRTDGGSGEAGTLG